MVNYHFFSLGRPEKSSALCFLEVGILSNFKTGKPQVWKGHSILTHNQRFCDKNYRFGEEK